MGVARIATVLVILSLLLGTLSCTGSVPLVGGGSGQDNLIGFINATATRSLDTAGEPSVTVASAAFFILDGATDNNLGIETKTFGSCVVTITPVGESDPDTELPTVSSLDAGAAGTVNNGTDMATMTKAQTGFYAATGDLSAQGFATGQLLTFEFPGGADILAFLAAILLPNEIVVNSPDLEDDDLSISNDAALTVTWSGAGGADSVNVSILSSDAESSVLIACTFDDNGAGTIPLAAMECLPDDPLTMGISVARTNTDEVMVNLVSGGMRVVRLTAQSGLSRSLISGLNVPDFNNGDEDFDVCQFLNCPDGQTCNPDTFSCE